MSFGSIETLIARVLTLVIGITIHEFAHALAADNLGDDLPRLQGRLTLNPLSHLDPLGSLMLVFAGFGWGKPVMTNPYNFRNGPVAGMAMVAVAGPLSNLLLALIAAVPVQLGLIDLRAGGFMPIFFLVFIQLNLVLLFLNLLPINPLDGFKVAMGILPRDWAAQLQRTAEMGPIILLMLIVLDSFGVFPLFSWVIGVPTRFFLNLLI